MGSGDTGEPLNKKRERGFRASDSGKFQAPRKVPGTYGGRDKPQHSSDSFDKSSRPFRDGKASRNRPGGYNDNRELPTGSHPNKIPRKTSAGEKSFRDRPFDSKRQAGASSPFGKRFPAKPGEGRFPSDGRPDRNRRERSSDRSSNENRFSKSPDGEKPFRRRSERDADSKAGRSANASDGRTFRGRGEEKDRPDGPDKRKRPPSTEYTKRGAGKSDAGKPFRGGGVRQKDDRFSNSSRSEELKKFDRSGVIKKDRPVKPDIPSAEPVKAGGTIRLNKFIANSGVCSRREADELITMGLISVNGKVITTLGFKVSQGDEVRHESKVLRAEKPVYILMNKPKGFLTTTTDPQERNTVMNLLGGVIKERVYPVGRLDRNTTGLLMLTNDGDLADKLMHPSHNVKKIYKVELDRPLTKADATKVIEGVTLEEGRAIVDDLAIISDDRKTLGLEIHIGWNRVVRRIFESLDYQVVKLDRSSYASLTKKDLGRGEWRFLKKEELILLKHFK